MIIMRKFCVVGIGGFTLITLFMLFSGAFFVSEITEKPALVVIPEPAVSVSEVEKTVVDFEKYDYDYVDEDVKEILNSMLGPSGKTAFYLPSTGYVNVSRGSKYGVAYALNNPNPSGENYFEFNWTAGETNCSVGLDVAQGWIERGWMSWGKIGEGWIDHMTVYFSFPSDVEACSVTYDFVIVKDGVLYDSKSVLFNLV